jgi:hypothetical protein
VRDDRVESTPRVESAVGAGAIGVVHALVAGRVAKVAGRVSAPVIGAWRTVQQGARSGVRCAVGVHLAIALQAAVALRRDANLALADRSRCAVAVGDAGSSAIADTIKAAIELRIGAVLRRLACRLAARVAAIRWGRREIRVARDGRGSMHGGNTPRDGRRRAVARPARRAAGAMKESNPENREQRRTTRDTLPDHAWS